MLVGAPHSVGTAVMLASFSGLAGTAQEAFSLGKMLASGIKGSNELIKEISIFAESSAAQHALRERVGNLDPQNMKAELSNMAMGEGKQAVDALKEKSPENVEPYKQWLKQLAFTKPTPQRGDFLGIGAPASTKPRTNLSPRFRKSSPSPFPQRPPLNRPRIFTIGVA